MGLLEKAQQRKQNLNETKDTLESDIVVEKRDKQIKTIGLLEKSKKREKQLSEKTRDIKEGIAEEILEKQEPTTVYPVSKDIIEEREGFGWKGQGIRRIVYDHKISEYVYEVSEPGLDSNDLEIKKELSHLFKMLADVNISSTENE